MSTSPRRISPPLNSLEGLPTPLTDGERHVLTLLNSELPEDWEIYIQPHLNGLRPDFVVTHPRCGIAVFEVKDWDLRAMNYRYEGERPNPILMADKGGHSFRKDDPIAKAVNYRTEVTDLYCPSLNTRQHYGLVSTGVLFTVASRADVQRVFIEEALEDLGFRNREQFILAAREDQK